MNVTMSQKIDLKEKVVRGMWWKNDFFSDLCPLFQPPKLEFVDLRSSVQTEWLIRKSMTEKHLKAMRKAREAYEQQEAEKLQEQKVKLTGKKEVQPKKKEDKKKKEVKKSPKSKVKFAEASSIPPIVDEATYIDVEDEYVEFEKFLREDELGIFSPANLGLKEFEVG
jgi:hypothetical protein